MKRMRIMGLGLIAVFAVAALVAASASATAPRFGRCLAHAEGLFTDGNCKTLAKTAGEGKFEFYPAFGKAHNGEEKKVVKGGYKSEAIGSSEHRIVLEGTGEKIGTKTEVECKKQTSDGTITSDTTASAEHIVYTGCESSKIGCNSTGASPGEIKVEPLTVTLGLEAIGYNKEKHIEEPAKDKAAQDFTPKSGTKIVEFTCATALHVIVESLGGRGILAPAKTNAMINAATVKFNGTGGGQKPEKLAESIELSTGKVTYSEEISLLAAFEKPPAGPEFEESGQTQTNNVKDEEKVEVNTVAF
jgi:hypothetical protein